MSGRMRFCLLHMPGYLIVAGKKSLGWEWLTNEQITERVFETSWISILGSVQSGQVYGLWLFRVGGS